MGRKALGNKIYTALTMFMIFKNSYSVIDILSNFIIFFIMAQQSPLGQGLPIIEDSRSYSDTPQSVGLLWMSDQPVAGTST
jgi:hypothetical protein